MGNKDTVMVIWVIFPLHESQSCHGEGACVLNEAISPVKATQDG